MLRFLGKTKTDGKLFNTWNSFDHIQIRTSQLHSIFIGEDFFSGTQIYAPDWNKFIR